MAETVQQLLRERAEDDNTAVRYGEESWTWREHVAEASAVASALLAAADPDRPMHVGTLLGNGPEMLRAMSLQDPKIFIALLTWGLYSFALFARRTMGWNGRRAAWLSALGFVIVLLNFLPISYFVTTSHTFN